MIEPLALLVGLGVPALLAAAIVTVGRNPAAGRAGWIAGAALGAGYVAGHAGFLGWPAFPARVAEQWLPYAAALGAALGVLTARAPRWLGWALRIALLATGLALWLKPVMTYRWTGAISAVWLAGLLLAALAVGAGLDRVLPALAPPAAWTVLATTFAGTALALALSGSLALGQLAGSAAAAASGGLVASLVVTSHPVGRDSVLVIVVLSVGLVLCGTFYSELPRTSALLLGAAPLAASVVPASAHARGGVRGALCVAAAVGIVAATAVVLAFASSPAPSAY